MVTINKQVWMAENLNFDPASGVARCYEDIEENCQKYGRLYDWATALSVCPQGWHLPSQAEWVALATYNGGLEAAGARMRSAEDGWDTGLNYVAGNDIVGFKALPGGYRTANDQGLGKEASWWSSTQSTNKMIIAYRVTYSSSYLSETGNSSEYQNSVRCLMNDP